MHLTELSSDLQTVGSLPLFEVGPRLCWEAGLEGGASSCQAVLFRESCHHSYFSWTFYSPLRAQNLDYIMCYPPLYIIVLITQLSTNWCHYCSCSIWHNHLKIIVKSVPRCLSTECRDNTEVPVYMALRSRRKSHSDSAWGGGGLWSGWDRGWCLGEPLGKELLINMHVLLPRSLAAPACPSLAQQLRAPQLDKTAHSSAPCTARRPSHHCSLAYKSMHAIQGFFCPLPYVERICSPHSKEDCALCLVVICGIEDMICRQYQAQRLTSVSCS